MEDEPTYINLNENFRVFRCDDRNLEVEQYRMVRAKKGKSSKKWISIGYYSNLPQAVNGVLEQYPSSFTLKEKMELRDVVSELKKVSAELITAVKESGIKLTDFVKVPDGRGRKKSVTVAKVKERKTTKKVATKKGKRGRPRKVTT